MSSCWASARPRSSPPAPSVREMAMTLKGKALLPADCLWCTASGGNGEGALLNRNKRPRQERQYRSGGAGERGQPLHLAPVERHRRAARGEEQPCRQRHGSDPRGLEVLMIG